MNLFKISRSEGYLALEVTLLFGELRLRRLGQM